MSSTLTRFAVLLSLSIAAALPAKESTRDYSSDEDVITLRSIQGVAFGSFWMRPNLSKGEAALGRILKRDDYLRPLIAAYNGGTPEAKVYVLAAFHELAPSLFEQCKQDLVGKYNPIVRSVSGCLGADGTLLEFLIRIQVGQFTPYIRQYADHEK